jgi:hypothetical protein
MKNKPPMTATELIGENPASPPPPRRKLTLKFVGGKRPQLDRAEFTCEESAKPGYWQQKDKDGDHNITWTKVPQAVSLLFLDYVSAGLQGAAGQFRFIGDRTGSLAASLGDAVDKREGKLFKLFAMFPKGGGEFSCVQHVFDGINVDGGKGGERCLWVKTDYLPFDCVQIFWDTSGRSVRVQHRSDIEKLAGQIRKAEGLAAASQLTPPEGEGREPDPSKPQVATPMPKVEPAAQTVAIQAQFVQLHAQVVLQQPAKAAPAAEPKTPKDDKPPLKRDGTVRETSDEFKPQPEPLPRTVDHPAARRIDRRLFEIQNPEGHTWEDGEGLVNFGDDSGADVWRVRDACEGVLIFGAPGSGKTSGSGSAIAKAFLEAGFGGLILTVKPDEARRWQRVCEKTGRAGDFIHVTPRSGHKLNFLQYEIQRPGERLAVTEDLIRLFRTLIGVMSHSKRNDTGDDFWTNATNQLMRKLVDIFLLAGEPVILEHMVYFINQAPKEPGQDWRNLEMFAEVIQRAGANVQQGNAVDKRIYRDCFDYWTGAYPAIADETRSGFVTAFSAMADVLGGRGIHEMIGEETNLTPEMILSGKIVVLDIPLEGNMQGGLMVQAMFKLLFQQAVHRRADNGLSMARPAFLWEDEGHMFFSQHDVDFQPTARDRRCPHVIISQNLHNFLQQGHNQHAVEAVFAAMNTYIFHTNGDMDTNRWASDKIGLDRMEILKGTGLLRPVLDENISFFKTQRPQDFKNAGGFRWEKEKEPAFPPENFAKLKRGGGQDGVCDAVVFWLAHQFESNHYKNFATITFAQER